MAEMPPFAVRCLPDAPCSGEGVHLFRPVGGKHTEIMLAGSSTCKCLGWPPVLVDGVSAKLEASQ